MTQTEAVASKAPAGIAGLFPVAVGQARLRPLTQVEREAILQPGPAQAAGLVLSDARLSDLRQEIAAQLSHYVAHVVCPGTDLQIAITQSWVTQVRTDAPGGKGARPNSWLSAILFLQADAERDRVCFHKSTFDRLEFQTHHPGPFNTMAAGLPVATGDLVVFPSQIVHEVTTCRANRESCVGLFINTWLNGSVGALCPNTGLADLTARVAGPFQ